MTDPEDVRGIEELESFEKLDTALQIYPEFTHIRNILGSNVAHFLIVHLVQYSRLKSAHLIAIPRTRFIVLTWPKSRRSAEINAEPAIVQERITGVRLFDMVNPQTGALLRRYKHLRHQLREQTTPLLRSNISIYIDWNIQNFVWNESEKCIYYVDNKPTMLASKFSVNHNLNSLLEMFVV
jgi:hypothetical protein